MHIMYNLCLFVKFKFKSTQINTSRVFFIPNKLKVKYYTRLVLIVILYSKYYIIWYFERLTLLYLQCIALLK